MRLWGYSLGFVGFIWPLLVEQGTKYKIVLVLLLCIWQPQHTEKSVNNQMDWDRSNSFSFLPSSRAAQKNREVEQGRSCTLFPLGGILPLYRDCLQKYPHTKCFHAPCEGLCFRDTITRSPDRWIHPEKKLFIERNLSDKYWYLVKIPFSSSLFDQLHRLSTSSK